ncbi:MAG: thioredoxin-disulfide reductase [Rickettsia sp.]|nr:thioredoxin-disulfide reductase [Rickettsia sp.]
MNESNHTQVLILGSGSAGLTAAIYSARAALKPILITGFEEGGQLTTTTEVENFPGFAKKIQGPWLMDQMQQQALNVGTKIINDEAISIDLLQRPFKVKTSLDNVFFADSIIIATGAQAKWLGIDSESYFQGFGVSGCATCDGVFFKGKDVVVIGGGNSAVEEALYLTHHAKKVYLLHRRDKLRAEMISQEKLFKNPQIEVIWDTVVEEIIGDEKPKSVTGVKVKNIKNNSEKFINCSGVFVAIGHTPRTDLVKNQINLDKEGYIITKPDSTQTSVEGVFAAGDVQDVKFRQAVTAAGTGCMAAIESEHFLRG